MLQIFPIESKVRQEELCLLCAAVYLPNALAYEATVDGEPVGICQFRLQERFGTLETLAPVKDKPVDKEALFIMCRAAMNFIDLCGVHTARFTGDTAPAGEQLIHALGFRPNAQSVWEMDLTDFFSSPCKHSKD